MTALLTRTTTHLVGDVGGTYLRLGLVREGEQAVSATTKLRCAEFPDVASALRSYLSAFPAADRPTRACLAVAGPVDGDRVRLTNNGFAFSTAQLQQEVGLDSLLVVNDVAAVARGVADVRPGQTLPLTSRGLDLSRTVAVVAPGTGLGVAALVPTPHGPVVLPGEGGQVAVPVTARSTSVVRELAGRGRALCAEELVSGIGLPRLDDGLRRLAGEECPEPRSAFSLGTSGETAPGQVLDVFVELLASLSQGYALTLGARGGVVLGGGFLRDLVPVLEECSFLERFRAHPKLSDYLADIPVVVDIRAHPALVGAAAFARDAT
jgi:glucokinase